MTLSVPVFFILFYFFFTYDAPILPLVEPNQIMLSILLNKSHSEGGKIMPSVFLLCNETQSLQSLQMEIKIILGYKGNVQIYSLHIKVLYKPINPTQIISTFVSSSNNTSIIFLQYVQQPAGKGSSCRTHSKGK